MKFGYAIFYVDDVIGTIEFYERAFGLRRRMIHEGQYGEIDTGGTTLAFSAATFARETLGLEFGTPGPGDVPMPVEIGLVTDDVQAAFDKAVEAGARPVRAPARKSWGQIVGYVRDNNGCLVELCTPVR